MMSTTDYDKQESFAIFRSSIHVYSVPNKLILNSSTFQTLKTVIKPCTCLGECACTTQIDFHISSARYAVPKSNGIALRGAGFWLQDVSQLNVVPGRDGVSLTLHTVNLQLILFPQERIRIHYLSSLR